MRVAEEHVMSGGLPNLTLPRSEVDRAVARRSDTECRLAAAWAGPRTGSSLSTGGQALIRSAMAVELVFISQRRRRTASGSCWLSTPGVSSTSAWPGRCCRPMRCGFPAPRSGTAGAPGHRRSGGPFTICFAGRIPTSMRSAMFTYTGGRTLPDGSPGAGTRQSRAVPMSGCLARVWCSALRRGGRLQRCLPMKLPERGRCEQDGDPEPCRFGQRGLACLEDAGEVGRPEEREVGGQAHGWPRVDADPCDAQGDHIVR